MFFVGLGAPVNTFAQQAANVSLIAQGQSGGEGVHSTKVGTFNITGHHWLTVYEQMYPGKLTDTFDLEYARFEQRQAKIRAAATAANLPACPVESFTDVGTYKLSPLFHTCYFGRYAPITEDADGTIGLLPPGTFEFYGVPFTIDEVNNGKFQKTFVPDKTQRKLIELAVIRRSHEQFFGEFTHHVYGQPVVRSIKLTGLWGIPMTALSVRQVLSLRPDMTMFLVNFERNPIQPTPAEYDSPGGWESWIMRGGYPLSRTVASSQVSLTEGSPAIQVCASTLCKCGTETIDTWSSEAGAYAGRQRVVGGAPSCVPATIGKNGIETGGADEARGDWLGPYVTINQDMNAPWFQMTLTYKDPSFIEKVGAAGAALMKNIASVMCMAREGSQEQIRSIVKDICTTSKGEVCTKGQPDCTCRPAPAASKISVSATNAIMAKWCGAWQGEVAPDPLQNLPPPSDAPLPPVPAGIKIPLWAIVLGGLGVGAVLFTRR